MENTYLAIDIGGGSGRVIAGTITNGNLKIDEIHRFLNHPRKKGDCLCWDFESLFNEILKGIKIASEKKYQINGIGIDTWGVDFGLIDRDGLLIGDTVCYRDNRTQGKVEEVFKLIDRDEHYSSTGIQVMNINTLFQLFCLKDSRTKDLEKAEKILFTPDLFAYFLTGIASNEYCIASSSELLDAKTRNWDYKLIQDLGLPKKLFGKITKPGTILGKLKPEIAEKCALKKVDVITIASHDTASAVIAIPTTEKNTAFLSSGTWSLVGVIIDEPILSKEAKDSSFTNEGAFGNKIRFLKNITGLWILQNLMKEWKTEGINYSYDQLLEDAEKCDYSHFVDVDDASFQATNNMEDAINNFLTKKDFPTPNSDGEMVRCVLNSLVIKYKESIETINKLLPQPIEKLHIIGGGSQNNLLNQLTADSLKIPVVAGPVEATAMGNILLQAYTKGDIKSIEEIKELVINSSNLKIFTPRKINV